MHRRDDSKIDGIKNKSKPVYHSQSADDVIKSKKERNLYQKSVTSSHVVRRTQSHTER